LRPTEEFIVFEEKALQKSQAGLFRGTRGHWGKQGSLRRIVRKIWESWIALTNRKDPGRTLYLHERIVRGKGGSGKDRNVLNRALTRFKVMNATSGHDGTKKRKRSRLEVLKRM